MNLLIPIASFTPNHWIVVAGALLVTWLGVARLVRVIVHDSFPPAVWWRTLWSDRITKNGPWSMLFTCFWCLPFWVVLVCAGWFFLGLVVVWVAWVWWIFWGALAIAYLASVFIRRDEPEARE